MRGNVIRDMAYFLLITVFIGLVILVVTTVFVLRPLGGMHAAFGELKQGAWARPSASARREGSEEPHRRLQRHGGRAAGHVRASGIAGAGAYGGPARGERPAGTPARQAGAA